MKTINFYTVKIVIKEGLIDKQGNHYRLEVIPVLKENDKRYCLDNERFTTVEKKKSDWDACLNKPRISSSVNDSCWGTGVRYYLHTDKNVRKSTIARQIAGYIDKKYGAFFDIDLTFLGE